MLFGVLHTAFKFESLHMLATLLSQKESERVTLSPNLFNLYFGDFSLTTSLYFWNTKATS